MLKFVVNRIPRPCGSSVVGMKKGERGRMVGPSSESKTGSASPLVSPFDGHRGGIYRQYWRPVWNILEESVAKLLLMNPLHVKPMAGRKTDRQDGRWLATRLGRDDLKGSFIPSREKRELRDLTRLRVHWLQDLNRMKNRITQVCEARNIKVSSVASDLFGVSGRRMLASHEEGRRHAGWIAHYARGTLRGKKARLELAPQGTFTHQRLLLGRMLAQLGGVENQPVESPPTLDRPPFF